MKIIEVTVSPQGEVRLETKGFAGASCEAASRELVAALGATTKTQRTSEFYVRQDVAQRQQIGGQGGGGP